MIKNLLEATSKIHDVIYAKYDDMDKILKNSKLPLKDITPISSIMFVEKFLKEVHGIDCMNPIEIPPVLRKKKYLKRRYAMLNKSNLPTSGYYFLKYASKLKDFTYSGLIDFLPKEDLGNGEPYLKDGKYVISEVVDILSEYRCFVLQDKIEAI